MARADPHPFLDTNVIFSGLYSARGSPARIVDMHVDGLLTIVVSSQVIEELVRAVRVKAPRLMARTYEFLEDTPPELSAYPEPDEIRRLTQCVNRADAAILAAAMGSEADCLVRGNSRHFTPEVEQCAEFPIFSPAAYLVSLESE